MDIGMPELVIILVILLLLFGSTRLPKLTRSIGESMRELRGGFEGKTDDKKVSKKSSDKKES